MKIVQDYCQFDKQTGQSLLDLSAPTCDTGAQIPAPCYSNIDWLEFRFVKKDLSLSVLASDFLGLDFDLFDETGKGMHGYPCVNAFGSIKILSDPHRAERGIKVILSGESLEQVKIKPFDIVVKVLESGGKFSRFDLALNDRGGFLDMGQIQKSILNGEAVSHFERGRPYQEYCLKTGEPVGGKTWYLGSASSLRQIRFYDKRAEQIDKGKDDPGQWVRAELQARKDAAHLLALKLAEQGMSAAPGIIRGVVDFRELGNDKTTRRVPLAWWDSFLLGVEVVRTGLGKSPKTIQKTLSWFSRQCSKSLGQILCLCGPEVIQKMIQHGIYHTTDQEWAMLDASHAPDRALTRRFERMMQKTTLLEVESGIPF